MKFSVLIPVYNVQEYLRQCIDSVVNQDEFTDYEVILVDDGSFDRSGDICDEYAEKYPHLIRVIHKQNQGLISARRIGINNAYGEYCVFVDSDDYVSSKLLLSLYNFIENNSSVDIVLYSFYYYDGTVGERYKSIADNNYIWKENSKKEIYELLATTPCIDALWTKAIKKDLLIRDPIEYSKYYNNNMSEDTLQSIYPLTMAQSIGYLDQALYYYRYNQNSISRSFDVESLQRKNTIHVYDVIIEVLPLWGMDNAEFRAKVNYRWFSEAMYLFCKCYENARTYMQRKKVLEFDYDCLIPIEAREHLNYYDNSIYVKIYSWLKKKEYIKIRWFFLKKNAYKKYKYFIKKR